MVKISCWICVLHAGKSIQAEVSGVRFSNILEIEWEYECLTCDRDLRPNGLTFGVKVHGLSSMPHISSSVDTIH